ncbi:hypothetical protein HK102_007469 [Quaeritorhiza haematococci]|nr:hypothetical protein HK102_007469 [Quaeritorhiza haematococci]
MSAYTSGPGPRAPLYANARPPAFAGASNMTGLSSLGPNRPDMDSIGLGSMQSRDSDFPALGSSNAMRDGSHNSNLLSFSTIASSNPMARDVRKDAEFTMDDFPALTPSNPQLTRGIIGGGAAATGLLGRDDMGSLLSRSGLPSQHQPLGAPLSGPNGPMNMLSGANRGTTAQQNGPTPAGAAGMLGGVKRPTNVAIGAPGTAPSNASVPNYAAKAGNLAPGQSQQPAANAAAGAASSLGQNATYTGLGSITAPGNAPAPAPGAGPVGSTPIPTNIAQDKFGLLGLIDVIRMTDQDTNMVALGLDLTALGLNLNATDSLYSTFMSPFATDPTHGAEPSYNLPPCYNLPQAPPPALSKISSFSEETLFYVFYAMPREMLQEAAAQELYNRGWRYHKELKLWLTKEAGSEVVVKGAGFERGVYIFFDPTSWNRVKKEWVLYYDQLEERGAVGAPNPGMGGRPGTPGIIGSGAPPPPPGAGGAGVAGSSTVTALGMGPGGAVGLGSLAGIGGPMGLTDRVGGLADGSVNLGPGHLGLGAGAPGGLYTQQQALQGQGYLQQQQQQQGSSQQQQAGGQQQPPPPGSQNAPGQTTTVGALLGQDALGQQQQQQVGGAGGIRPAAAATMWGGINPSVQHQSLQGQNTYFGSMALQHPATAMGVRPPGAAVQPPPPGAGSQSSSTAGGASSQVQSGQPVSVPGR